MDDRAAQSLIRFGLGKGANNTAPSDPRGALLAQLHGPDPGLASGAFDDLPAGLAAMDALQADAKARRAALMQKSLPGSLMPLTNAMFKADTDAQMDWACSTPAGFRERLVWFWTNHFTVSTAQGETAALIGPMIREAIRPNVTGKFTDMVLAVERHPAMLRYLMNDSSVGPDSLVGQRRRLGLNENLGRECMELHTVGLSAGYRQADVTSMARILTGWSVSGSASGGDATGFRFRPGIHEPGPQTLLGQTFLGGQRQGVEALTFLSRYPPTYRLLAHKLVTHFVADNPPSEAVARIARVLCDTEGDLGAAAAALTELPQAWTPLTKLKTPLEFMVSAMRALPPVGKPVNYRGISTQLGQPLWGAPLPNGWPDQAAAWAGADALLIRVDWAFTYAARFDYADIMPADVAAGALGSLLRPATRAAIAVAPSRREALTLLLTAPEFQRR